MTTTSRSAWIGFHFAATIFLSAFLLFQVQPLITKFILPWFGGSPAVWTTCVLFFQTALFAGYAYAHFSEHYLRAKVQTVVHLVLIVLALLTLPIAPSDLWKPEDGANPTGRILVLLAICVGLPYFVLSSTGPLVQAWFTRCFPNRSPYRLYALSNIGSLLALLSYPFVLEPAFDVNTQAWCWSAGFVVFGILYGYAALRVRDVARPAPAAATGKQAASEQPPSVVTRLLWLALPAFASMMLLATTNHVCQDVAVIPFLWVIPLSLYLISFIISFDHPRWYVRPFFAILALVSIYLATGVDYADDWTTLQSSVEWVVGLTGQELGEWNPRFNFKKQLLVHFAVLFSICMICHGELVRLRPAPRYLTSFYLMISLGGALGGLFVSLIAPYLFDTYFEWKIGLVGGFLLAAFFVFGIPFWNLVANGQGWNRVVAYRCIGLIVAGLAFWEMSKMLEAADAPKYVYERGRNFYGTLKVIDRDPDDPEGHDVALYNGRILHGVQFAHPDQRDWATTYFSEDSGVGKLLLHFQDKEGMRAGVIGLGVGTLASYIQAGQTIRFYEINPKVVQVADKYFSFLKDARARDAVVEIVPGDARLSMERELKEGSQKYDVLALDAFSGDAIPNHLLTKEAFEIYLAQLADGGAIAAHVSNLYLDLPVVVYGLAKHFDLEAVRIESPDEYRYAVQHSDWIILSKNKKLIEELRSQAGESGQEEPPKQPPLWTDQEHNLFEILR